MHHKPLFTLSQFEGPLEFLITLIQKEEIAIQDVECQSVIKQFLATAQLDLTNGADFVSAFATMIWMKARSLLPAHEQIVQDEEENGVSFDLVPHLIDYCRFKQAAKQLVEIESEQSHYFLRGETHIQPILPAGVHHLSIQDLASLFQDILKKTTVQMGTIAEESTKVSDKVALIRLWIKREGQIAFYSLFELQKSKLELIVTFLALLELMKLGEIKVLQNSNSPEIIIQSVSYEQRI